MEYELSILLGHISYKNGVMYQNYEFSYVGGNVKVI